MRKILYIIVSLVTILSVTSCKKEKKNSLELFLDTLQESESFRVEASLKRDYFPVFDYYLNLDFDDKKVYVETNYQFKNYGQEYYADLRDEDNISVYYKKNDVFIKEEINNSLLEVNISSKLSIDDFVLNEDNEYEMTEETLKKFNFKSATISLNENDSATIKAYILYNYLELPVYINIYNTAVSVTLPTV